MRPGQLVPLPQRAAGVAALDRAVHVVPVVEHPELHLRPLGDVESIDRLSGLQQAQEVIRAVERADLAGRGDGDAVSLADAAGPDDESFWPGLLEVGGPPEAANQLRVRRCADNDVARTRAFTGQRTTNDRRDGRGHLVANDAGRR